MEEARKEEEEERKARLGPGGLDPVEVFESLPDVSFLSNCIFPLTSDHPIKIIS